MLIRDPADHVYRFKSYESEVALLNGIETHWPVERLQRFTHGFYKVQQQDNEIQMIDLRMGVEGAYIFAFVVGEVTDNGSVAIENKEADNERDFSLLPDLLKRIFDPEIELF